MWSTPPAEPPAQEIAPGLARKAASRSSSVWKGELAGTAITSYSAVSLAMGVVSARVTADWLVRMAPTMTRPVIISRSPEPRSAPASRARPMVPPAPGTVDVNRKVYHRDGLKGYHPMNADPYGEKGGPA